MIDRAKVKLKATACLLSISLAVFFFSLAAYAQEDFEIKLKSRQFTPQEAPISFLEDKLLPTTKERVYVIVQFHELPDASVKQQLEDSGINLLSYIPNKAWFASIPSSLGADAASISYIRWIGDIVPEDKISPRVMEQGVGSWAKNSDGTVNLRISIFKDVDFAQARHILETSAVLILKEEPKLNKIQISINPDMIESLAKEDIIQWITDVPPPIILENDGARQNVDVDFLHALPYSLEGAGIVVGIWDGGEVDETHDDLSGRVTIVDNVGISDHATHVAGILAGDGSLSESEGGNPEQWKGMAPLADLVSYSSDFNNGDNIEDLEHAITNHDIDISQNSWGHGVGTGSCAIYGNYDHWSPDYDALIHDGFSGERITIVFSAGNERDDGDCGIDTRDGYGCINPPKPAKNIIAVGAINSDDDSMTAFSSWGPVDDGRIKPDVVAPGCEDDLNYNANDPNRSIWSTIPGDTYHGNCGTSMAAPVVSGISALMIEQFRDLYGADPLPSTVKAILINTAQDLGNQGPDYAFGFGKVDALAAVNTIRAEYFAEGQFDGPNGVEPYQIIVPNGSNRLQITLAWDDFAGTENANPALVNQLDLVLYDPDGNLYRPWELDPSNPGTDAVECHLSQPDYVNNVEQITIDSPMSGDWTAYVMGTEIPEFAQSYSIVWSGAEKGHGGLISHDTTWSVADSPHIIFETVTVGSDATLTIESGAEVRFLSGKSLNVDGRLIANNVTFTSIEAFPEAGNWQGIVFTSLSNNKTSSLTNCTLEYSTNAITFEYASVPTTYPITISDCWFRNHTGNGISVYGNAPIITDNAIIQYGNNVGTGTGIYCTNGRQVTISGNVIQSHQYGIHAYSYSYGAPVLSVTGNTISNNTTYGLYLRSYSASYYGPEATINNNNIFGNGDYDLYTRNYRSAASTIIDAERNWWNTANLSEISARIYDFSENSNSPTVDFEPILYCSASPEAPSALDYSDTVCDTALTVSWNVVEGSTGYKLERGDDIFFNNPVIVYEGNNTSHLDQIIELGSYWYRVLAVNECGEGGWKIGEHAVVVAPPITTPSTISYPASDSDGSFIVSWSPVTGALNYTLERAQNSAYDNPDLIFTGDSTEYQETSLEGGSYWYRVRANNGCCDSEWRSGTYALTVPIPCEGNFDSDGDVDGSDLAIFAADFGRTNCSGDCEGDFDGDGDVDGSDLATFAADFGRTDCP